MYFREEKNKKKTKNENKKEKELEEEGQKRRGGEKGLGRERRRGKRRGRILKIILVGLDSIKYSNILNPMYLGKLIIGIS